MADQFFGSIDLTKGPSSLFIELYKNGGIAKFIEYLDLKDFSISELYNFIYMILFSTENKGEDISIRIDNDSLQFWASVIDSKQISRHKNLKYGKSSKREMNLFMVSYLDGILNNHEVNKHYCLPWEEKGNKNEWETDTKEIEIWPVENVMFVYEMIHTSNLITDKIIDANKLPPHIFIANLINDWLPEMRGILGKCNKDSFIHCIEESGLYLTDFGLFQPHKIADSIFAELYFVLSEKKKDEKSKPLPSTLKELTDFDYADFSEKELLLFYGEPINRDSGGGFQHVIKSNHFQNRGEKEFKDESFEIYRHYIVKRRETYSYGLPTIIYLENFKTESENKSEVKNVPYHRGDIFNFYKIYNDGLFTDKGVPLYASWTESYKFKNGLYDGEQIISHGNRILVKAQYKRGVPHGVFYVECNKTIFFYYGIIISQKEYLDNLDRIKSMKQHLGSFLWDRYTLNILEEFLD